MSIKEQGLYCLLDVHLLDKCGCMRNCCYTAALKEGGLILHVCPQAMVWGFLRQNEMYSYMLQKIAAVWGASTGHITLLPLMGCSPGLIVSQR